MATITVSLPEQMKDWIENLTRQGEYASSSDYVRDLVRRDRERRVHAMTLEEVRQLVADARAGGDSERTIEEIFQQALNVARADRPKR